MLDFIVMWMSKVNREMGYITIIPWARVGYEVIKITNERVARVGYNHFISNEGEWNNCFSKFSNRVLPPIFVSTILQSVRKENLAHYFSYDVKLRLLAHSRSVLANQKARNAIVGAENLLNTFITRRPFWVPGEQKALFLQSSLALDERLAVQNLLFQHCVIKVYYLTYKLNYVVIQMSKHNC